MIDNHNPLAGSHEWYVKQQAKDRRDRIAEGFAFSLAANPSYTQGPKATAQDAVFMAAALIAELDKP